MYNLDLIQKLVHVQAITKGWKTEPNYCAKRAFHELDELLKAMRDNESQTKITLEIIDVIYFLVQIAKARCPDVSLNDSFEIKYLDNWHKKKKTEDEKGNTVRY